MPADEPRRSGRATKGQHTKNPEDASPNNKTPKGRKRSAKGVSEAAEEGDEGGDDGAEEVIRCVCGDREEVAGLSENPKMICCDKCEAWQHNVCMAISDDDKLLPEQYFCERCRPQNHRELLAAMARGEKPWEARLLQLKEIQKQKKSKKAKKGKSVRGSGIGVEEEVSAPTPSSQIQAVEPPTRPQQDAPSTFQMPVTPTTQDAPSIIRRKSSQATEENPLKRRPSSKLEETAVKRRKSSVVFDSPINHIDNLPEDRKKTAQPLFRLLKTLIESGVKTSTIALPAGVSNADQRAEQLARDIEHEVYSRFPRSEEVTSKNDQLRSILFNLKKNQALFQDLFAGDLAPSSLAFMSGADMASEEVQKERAAIKAEADKQATILHEEGPRVRKTHKGDEIIITDEYHHHPPTAEPLSATFPPNESQIPQSPIGDRPETDRPAGLNLTGLDTSNGMSHYAPGQPSPRHDRKSSSNFDIQSVWSKVKSPDVPQNGFASLQFRPPTLPSQASEKGPGEDADIDRLLRDDDMEGAAPLNMLSNVWHGNLYMRKQHSPLTVRGSAQFFGGANAGTNIPWNQLLAGDVEVNGRIATERADEYLCNFRWSATKIITILRFVPEKSHDDLAQASNQRSDFKQIFDYFLSIDRWGVSKSSDQPDGLLDFYIVPVRAGSSPMPKCFEYIENISLEGARSEDSLFFVLVVQARGTPMDPATPVLPSAPKAVPEPAPKVNQGKTADTVITPVAPRPEASPAVAIAEFNPPKLAVEVLGKYVHTPVARTVLQLPDVSLQQLENLKHAFETDEKTRNDVNYLMQFLKAEASQRAMQGRS